MKIKYKIWFVLTSINVSFFTSAFVYLLIWTIVMFASYNEGTSFPWYGFVPFLIALLFGLFPLFYSLLLGFKKMIRQEASLNIRKQIFWFNASCLIYLGIVLLVCFLFFLTNWNVLGFGIHSKYSLLSYFLLILICSIHPFFSFLVFRKG